MNTIIGLTDAELAAIAGGDETAYGVALAAVGLAVVGAIIVVAASPVAVAAGGAYGVALAVTGMAAFFEGAYYAY